MKSLMQTNNHFEIHVTRSIVFSDPKQGEIQENPMLLLPSASLHFLRQKQTDQGLLWKTQVPKPNPLLFPSPRFVLTTTHYTQNPTSTFPETERKCEIPELVPSSSGISCAWDVNSAKQKKPRNNNRIRDKFSMNSLCKQLLIDGFTLYWIQHST